TSFTTLLVLICLFLLGGETVSGFALALIVGVVVGTYSSIYVASASALALNVSPADLIPPKREEIDSLP
ncbi:MAG: protein translocase subunit SecF, partial [Rhodospirillaceae bacterium]|nr:protein translocase subunit SecF [Rhodospirillaceae bacterium]